MEQHRGTYEGVEFFCTGRWWSTPTCQNSDLNGTRSELGEDGDGGDRSSGFCEVSQMHFLSLKRLTASACCVLGVFLSSLFFVFSFPWVCVLFGWTTYS